jgi:predicted metal-dependent peptidase
MDSLEQISKARTWLMLRYPFFGYLAMYLRFHEKPDEKTMGVNSRGDVYYGPEFVSKLSKEELAGVIAHEILHLVLDHLRREGKRCHLLWNVAADATVDTILNEVEGPMPVWRDFLRDLCTKLEVPPESLRGMWAESVYTRLQDRVKVRCGGGGGSCKGCPAGEFGERDRHILDGDGENPWRGRFFEAYLHQKARGNVPAGLERLYSLLSRGPTLDWRSLLWRYVTSALPVDFTWLRPSKKFGEVYLPSIVRESLECVIAVDTSGSIDQEELDAFMTEVMNILKSFENIDAWLICCDCEVHEVYRLGGWFDPSVVRLRGGGGTSHKPVFEWIAKERPGTQLAICLTDGHSEFPERQPLPAVVWVVSRKGDPDEIPWGMKVRMA